MVKPLVVCMLLSLAFTMPTAFAEPDPPSSLIGYCIIIAVGQVPPVAIDLNNCKIPPEGVVALVDEHLP